MTPSVIFIAILGYITYRIESISRDKRLQKENGWALIFRCLTLGIPSFLCAFVLTKVFGISPLNSDGTLVLSKDLALIVLITTMASCTLGYIISRNSFIERFDFFKQHLRKDSLIVPPEGLLYKFFYRCLSSSNIEGETSLIHITLKNRKAYIAILEHADLNVNLDPCEMTFSITPLISGYRKTETLEVVYTTNYAEEISSMIEKAEFDDGDIEEEVNNCKKILKMNDIDSISLFSPIYLNLSQHKGPKDSKDINDTKSE